MQFALKQSEPDLSQLIDPQRIFPRGQNRYLLEATVVGVFPTLLVYWLCTLALPNRTIFFWLNEPIWVVLGIYVAMSFVHEACHLLVSPKFGFTKDTVTGFDLKIMCPFVNVNVPMRRNFFVAQGLAPLIVITLISLLIVFSTSDAFVAGCFATLALTNAHACGADLLTVAHCLSRSKSGHYFLDEYCGRLS